MAMNTRKLLHSLGALTDLGVEISSSHDFDEVVQASLHTLLGTLAIKKGAISRYSSKPGQLKIIAAKGLKDAVGSRVNVDQDEVDVDVDNARRLLGIVLRSGARGEEQ